ncbi:MAG: lipopolysaccharide biosynthesis protein [Acidimicrobiia bacterium]|nr:lipopolysaccharide biosynthesis protein [Acidimicrobiia bacterium]
MITSIQRARSRLSGGGRGAAQRIGWSTIVELSQLASSVLVFLILARQLHPDDYGALGAVLGVATPVATLASLGSHVLLIKRIAQGGNFTEAWQRATSIGILGPAAGTLVLVAAKPLILPQVSTTVYTLLVVSQVNFFWVTELAVYVGNATRNLKAAAQIRLMVVATRFAALALFATLTPGRLVDWAVASIASFAVGAALALAHVWRVFGARPSLRRGSAADVREGLPFSANAVTESLVDISDRPLLFRYGHETDAGIYTLGGRIIQFGYVPIRILLRTVDADLFAAGRNGATPALAVTRRLLRPAVAVGLAAGAAAFVCASMVPWLVGDEYRPAVETIRLLAPMPAIRAVQYLMGNCLSASGQQRWRLILTVAAGMLNLGLNLVLLPNGTWRTAVGTTFVSELFLTAALTAVALGSARGRPAPHSTQPGGTDR